MRPEVKPMSEPPLVTLYNERFMADRETPWTLPEVLASQWKVVHALKRTERLLHEETKKRNALVIKVDRLENPKVKCPRPHHLLLEGERCPTCKQTMRR